MTVAFIANHQKTMFFHAIASRLEMEGHRVLWISPGRRWARWLMRNGVAPEQILDVTLFGAEWAVRRPLTEAELSDLARLENSVGCSINNTVLMDRLLRRKPEDYGRRYMAVSQRLVGKFLRDNDVQCVFSEHTWTLEILTAYVCADMGIMNLAPMAARIPDGRFAFFSDHVQSRILELREVTDDDRRMAETFFADFVERRPKPRYFFLNSRIPRPSLLWLPKLFKNLLGANRFPFDETIFPPAWLIARRFGEVLRARIALAVKPFARPQVPASHPFVLYTLHVQPESSIDVCGAYFSDQIEVVKTLVRSLPVTHDLYVKEHANGIGNRTTSYYNTLKRIPGVRLIDPYVDTFSLIAEADLVVSISGTVLYEAALLGVPAISVVPVFFGGILTRSGFDPHSNSLSKELVQIGQSIASTDENAKRVDFLAWIIAQSFPGIIGDPVHDPKSMSDENLDLVEAGFLEMLRGASRNLPQQNEAAP